MELEDLNLKTQKALMAEKQYLGPEEGGKRREQPPHISASTQAYLKEKHWGLGEKHSE